MGRRGLHPRRASISSRSVVAAVACYGLRLWAADCNENGVEDAEEIAAGLVSDCDGNGVPDPCPVASEIRFLEPTRYPAGAYSRSIVSGDFDGDGRIDLATANAEGGDVTVLWNQGERRFLSAEGIPVGSAPVAIEAADIDRDGDVDLLVPVFGDSAVAVLANDGSRTFSAARTVSAGGAVQGVRACDIDGDGWEDLALHLKTGIEIAWGEGPGVLGEARTVLQTARPKDAAIADIDRDSILDVIAMQNVKLSIFFQRRSRFFVKVEHPLSASFSSLRLADLNGDGALDLVGNEGQELRVFLNDGHGGFPGGASVRSPFAVRATALLASDIDLDGDADILAGSCDGGSVSVALNDGSGRFLSPRHYALRNCAPLVSGDLDGDGDLDVVATEGFHVAVWFTGEGGSLGGPVRIPAGDDNRSQALADLEDDGDVDVVVVSAGSDEAIVLVNEGGGTLRLSDHVLEVGPDPLDVATFDANADGLPDFAFRGLNSLGFVAVLNRSVRGVFDANRNGVPDSCEVPFHRGDADGDGLLSVADAQFVISYVLYGTAAPACLAAADENGDRRVDISDGIFVLNYLFQGKAPPPSPGPPPGGCGIEPGGEEEARPALGCERYERC